jgi:hypothetical protein
MIMIIKFSLIFHVFLILSLIKYQFGPNSIYLSDSKLIKQIINLINLKSITDV